MTQTADQQNSKLIVEGKDDKHLVSKFLEKHCLAPSFSIDEKEGYENLCVSISPELKVPGRRALGILVDADDSIEDRWKSISGLLRGAECDVPNAHSQNGSVFDGPKGIKVGVWIMPDNQNSGELEDFVHALIPAGDPVLPLAKCYINNIPVDARKFKVHKFTRAYVHAWLAARKRPRQIGTAITAGDLSLDSELAASFVAWLRKLFDF